MDPYRLPRIRFPLIEGITTGPNDALDGQVEYKRHKKMEMDKIKNQRSDSLMESERLHRMQDVEKKKQKLGTQDKTEQNTRAQRIRHYELYQSVGESNEGRQYTSAFVRDKKDKNLEKSRVGEIEARRQKKDPQQKLKTLDKTKKLMDNTVIMQWEMHHSVTEQGRDVQYESGSPTCQSDWDIPDKDRSREINKKIVYNQLLLIEKEEAKKRAFMEDVLLKERKQRESAEQKREKLEKEKKAAAMKSLINSWDSEIKRKLQEQKKLCEFERKEMQSLMELDKMCGVGNIQLSHQTYIRPERSTSKNRARRSVCSADKQDNPKTRPLLSRQKVSNTNPVTLPKLESNTAHVGGDFKMPTKRIRLPIIYIPE